MTTATPIASRMTKIQVRRTRPTLQSVRSLDGVTLAKARQRMDIGNNESTLNRAEREHENAIKGSFIDGIVPYTDVVTGEPLKPIWFGIYPASVTILVGGSGTGKSSLLYGIAISIALNEPYLNVPNGLERPGRVLYVDPENAGPRNGNFGGVRAQRLDRIDKPRTSDLIFHDWRNLDLADPVVLFELGTYIIDEKIDLCILDPLANVYNTGNENDNAEAARQMKALVNLSRETGAATVLAHHTGKNHDVEGGGGNEGGRGASARFCAADNALYLRPSAIVGEVDDDYFATGRRQPKTLIRIQETKNRWEPRASLYIKMAGNDKFALSDRGEWKNNIEKTQGPDKQTMARQAVVALLADYRLHSRRDILAALSDEGFGRPMVESALQALETSQSIKKRKQDGTTGFAYHSAEVTGEQAEWAPIVGDLPTLCTLMPPA